MPPPFFIKRGALLTPNNKDFFTVVVSKKVCAKAVGRNLLKRRGRHLFRELKPRLKPFTRQIVLIFKPGASKLSFSELKKLLLQELQQLNYV